MSAICDFYLEMAERGLCPIEDGETPPAGVTTTTTEYLTRFGETMSVPVITTVQAHAWSRRPDCPEAVRAFLHDFDVEILEGRTARGIAATAARLAGEIVAAVTAGSELPDEWHNLDCYADIGEPVACEIVRLVREELLGTGITA